MFNLSRLVTICATAAWLTMAGCGGGDEGDDGGHSHSHEGDHGHSHEGDDGHSHEGDDGHEHEGDDHDHDHDHGDLHELGTLTLGGAVLTISTDAELAPELECVVDVTHTDGPKPAAVRVWIGVESGVGSIKELADDEGDHFHAHVSAPKDVSDETALWIEVEDADGTRHPGSLSLQ